MSGEGAVDADTRLHGIAANDGSHVHDDGQVHVAQLDGHGAGTEVLAAGQSHRAKQRDRE